MTMFTLVLVAVLAIFGHAPIVHALLATFNGSTVSRFDASVAECTSYDIPLTLTSENIVFDIPEFKDNFDVADLITRQSSKDTNTTIFNPISGVQNVTATYAISGSFCYPKNSSGREKNVLLATHGVHYDGRYWDSSYKPENYSFVETAVAHGYSVFYYDRLGTGKSQKVSGYTNQLSIQVEIIASLSRLLRDGAFNRQVETIALIGHSFGSFASNNVITKYPHEFDAVVLTGLSYSAEPWGSKVLIEAFAPRIAKQLYPSCYYSLSSGYLTFADIFAHVNTFFKAPYEIEVAKYAQSIVQPFAISELLSLTNGNPTVRAPDFEGPVYITAGEFDYAFCTGECYTSFAADKQVIPLLFPKSRKLESYVHPGAGHGINFGQNATGFYRSIMEFLESAGL